MSPGHQNVEMFCSFMSKNVSLSFARKNIMKKRQKQLFYRVSGTGHKLIYFSAAERFPLTLILICFIAVAVYTQNYYCPLLCSVIGSELFSFFFAVRCFWRLPLWSLFKLVVSMVSHRTANKTKQSFCSLSRIFNYHVRRRSAPPSISHQ